MSIPRNNLVPQYFLKVGLLMICKCNGDDRVGNNNGIEEKEEAQCGFKLKVFILSLASTLIFYTI